MRYVGHLGHSIPKHVLVLFQRSEVLGEGPIAADDCLMQLKLFVLDGADVGRQALVVLVQLAYTVLYVTIVGVNLGGDGGELSGVGGHHRL